MVEKDADLLERMMRETAWIWILGNHDPEPPARFAATCYEERRFAGLVFRHEPESPLEEGEIAGHFHPCARVISEGRILRRRCFMCVSRRLILPALGAYTGGLNVLDEAFEPLFESFTAWVMGKDGVYPIRRQNLAPDAHSQRHQRYGRVY